MSRDDHRRRSLRDEERALWDVVTQPIKPLRKKASAKPAAEGTAPRRDALPRATPVSPASPPPPAPPLVPLGRRMRSRVARGREEIDARLDLHGHTQAEAHAELLRFLRRSAAHDARLVLVITGKSGVLRRQVPQWLNLPELRPLVIGFEEAGVRHGGEGALYLRLRRPRA